MVSQPRGSADASKLRCFAPWTSQLERVESEPSRRTGWRKTICIGSTGARSLRSRRHCSTVGVASRKATLKGEQEFRVGAILRRMLFKEARDFLVQAKVLSPPRNALSKFRLAALSVHRATHKVLFKKRLHETFLQSHLEVLEAIYVSPTLLAQGVGLDTASDLPVEGCHGPAEVKALATAAFCKKARRLASSCRLDDELICVLANMRCSLTELGVESAKVAENHEAVDSQLEGFSNHIDQLYEKSELDLNLGRELSKQIQHDILRARQLVDKFAGFGSGTPQDRPEQQLEEELEHESALNAWRSRKTWPSNRLQPAGFGSGTHQDGPEQQSEEALKRQSALNAWGSRKTWPPNRLQPLIDHHVAQEDNVVADQNFQEGARDHEPEQQVEGEFELESALNAWRRRKSQPPNRLQPLPDHPAAHEEKVVADVIFQEGAEDDESEETEKPHKKRHGSHKSSHKSSRCSSKAKSSRMRFQRVRSVSTASGESSSSDTAESEQEVETPEVRDTNRQKHAVCNVSEVSQYVDSHKSPDAGCGVEEGDMVRELEPALPDPPVPILPCFRWGKPGRREGKPKAGEEGKTTAVFWCDVPRAVRCVGCISKLMGEPSWKHCSATKEAEDSSNNHGTDAPQPHDLPQPHDPPQPHDLIGGFGECHLFVSQRGENWWGFCKSRRGSQGTALHKQLIQAMASSPSTRTPTPTEQQQQHREDRRPKLSESALAAGVASFLGIAGHGTDAVMAALRATAPEVRSQSHARTGSVTPGFLAFVKDRPPPIEVPSDPSDGAFALEHNKLSPSSSESDEEKGIKSPHQDLGQQQAAWPRERAHSGLAGWSPSWEARSPLAHSAGSAVSTKDTWLQLRSTARTLSRNSQNSSRCFDAGAALSKARRQEVVLGSPNDLIGSRPASGTISPRSDIVHRRSSTGMVVKQAFLEEFACAGRQASETPRASSSGVHKRPDVPFPMREIEDPRSLQASRKNSKQSSTGSKQDAKQAAAISAELTTRHSLSVRGRHTFPNRFRAKMFE